MKKNKGFTLIELLVVMGIIAIIATIVLIAINPARQFKQSRDTQRTSNVNTILNAIGQNIADNKGIFTCNGSAYTIASAATVVKKGASDADLRPCLVPTYISELPVDPNGGTNTCVDNACTTGDYDSKYSVFESSTGRITVSAVGEITTSISVTR